MTSRLVFALCIILCSTTIASAFDFRNQGPKGPDWVKTSSGTHYLSRKSVQRVQSNQFRAEICNEASNNSVRLWNYFKAKVDCKTHQAWDWDSYSKVWDGPIPTNLQSEYHAKLFEVACKSSSVKK